jgi:hypothetical protein
MLQRTLPAGFIAPCLPAKTDTLPSGGLWIHEIKHDGFRIIAPGLAGFPGEYFFQGLALEPNRATAPPDPRSRHPAEESVCRGPTRLML